MALERSAERRDAGFLARSLFLAFWTRAANLGIAILRAALFRSVRRLERPSDVVALTVGTLGDNVLMVPAVAALKRRFPGARLTVLTNCDGFGPHPAREIFGALSFVDRFIAVPSHPIVREGFRFAVRYPEVEALRCDLFVNLSPFGNRGWIGAVVRELILARRLGAKAAVGFSMGTYSRKGIFNRVQHRFMRNEARRTVGVLGELGCRPAFGEDLLRRDDVARRRVLGLLDSHHSPRQPIVVLTPGSKLRASQWPPERFGALAAWLVREHGACVVLNGAESEKALCAEVRTASGDAALDLAGSLGIQDLVELLRMSDGCVSNNTGPMTISAALGVPTVVVASTRFSPTLYMPVTDRQAWLFSFDASSYSYDDGGGPAGDLLRVGVEDMQRAVRDTFGLGGGKWAKR